MKLVDLEQQIFVPVVDETHGGVTVEMKMTVGDFFGKFCEGFAPEIINIPADIAQKFGIESKEDKPKKRKKDMVCGNDYCELE